MMETQRSTKRKRQFMVLLLQQSFQIIVVMTAFYNLLLTNHFLTKQNDTYVALNASFNDVKSFSSSQPSSVSFAKGTQEKKSQNVAIIAINPDSKERLVALWSQLECFFSNAEKFGEVIISAPIWAKEEGLIDPFLQNAKETLPHFRDGAISLSLQYYTNDSYDVGLWCDALLTENGGIGSSILDRNTGSFIIINDSIMAVEREWTQVLDVLNEKQLSMCSLNYSLQGGYWLESIFRGFSKKGIKKFTEYACEEEAMAERCPMPRADKHKYKRCVVEKYEIHVGRDLFPRDEVWGIYPSDTPRDILVKAKHLETNAIGRTTWVMNPKYFTYLREELQFPAVKVSNPSYFFPKFYYSKKWKHMLGTCTTQLNDKFLDPMGDRIHKNGKRSPKYERWRYLDFFQEEDFKKRDHNKKK